MISSRSQGFNEMGTPWKLSWVTLCQYLSRHFTSVLPSLGWSSAISKVEPMNFFQFSECFFVRSLRVWIAANRAKEDKAQGKRALRTQSPPLNRSHVRQDEEHKRGCVGSQHSSVCGNNAGLGRGYSGHRLLPEVHARTSPVPTRWVSKVELS